MSEIFWMFAGAVVGWLIAFWLTQSYWLAIIGGIVGVTFSLAEKRAPIGRIVIAVLGLVIAIEAVVYSF